MKTPKHRYCFVLAGVLCWLLAVASPGSCDTSTLASDVSRAFEQVVSSARQGVIFDAELVLDQSSAHVEEGNFLLALDGYALVYSHATGEDLRSFGLVRMADVLALHMGMGHRATGLYRQAIREFPDSPYLDNAYFNGGLLLYRQNTIASLNEAERFFSGYVLARGKRLNEARTMLSHVQAARSRLQKKQTATGTTPKPAPLTVKGEPVIRVSLGKHTKVKLGLPKGGVLSLGDGRKMRVKAGIFSVTSTSTGLVLGGGKLKVAGNAEFTPTDGVAYCNGAQYAGSISLYPQKSQVLVVNSLGLETYVRGVVPGEMPASFHLEALKAQAVAARSYALFRKRTAMNRQYDLTNTAGSQVYLGLDAGSKRTRKAVAATKGRVLIADNLPLAAFYHSHSGGMVEDDADVWGGDSPVFSARNDSVSNRARSSTWKFVITGTELAEALKKRGFAVNRVEEMKVVGTTRSKRIARLELTTDKGPLQLSGIALRSAIGASRMKSTKATIVRTGFRYEISGTGNGHGVGMSQWGAQGLASGGKKYTDILGTYYPGTMLKSLY